MLYFVIDSPNVQTAEKVLRVTEDHAEAKKSADGAFMENRWVIDRWSIKTEADAIKLAALCNRFAEFNMYVWVDRGAHTAPRYDVARAPRFVLEQIRKAIK